jgi:rare lipoprotein A
VFAYLFSFAFPEKSLQTGAAIRLALLIVTFSALSACDLKFPSFGDDKDESNQLSPRVVEPGQPVPKGGGRYKLGSPYRIKGKLYVPRDVTSYERTGIASWYGELFHGRRTANGEVYDMEALTAAHPTLPLPSYVRVTNLRNGRSLIVRVNDRGPYSSSRLIDLSWATAALLKMQSAGTAPVRVEYLGRAPLNGNDRKERDFLARQRWAGPQIANAPSPAVAMHRSKNIRRQENAALSGQKDELLTTASNNTQQTGARIASLRPVPPLPVSRASAMQNHETPAPRPAQNRAAAPIAAISSAQGSRSEMQQMRFYVDAGWFDQKSVAEDIAAILAEIAPASVKTSRSGTRTVHLIRLGPFKQGADAHAAANKIRAAGLKEAQVEALADG